MLLHFRPSNRSSLRRAANHNTPSASSLAAWTTGFLISVGSGVSHTDLARRRRPSEVLTHKVPSESSVISVTSPVMGCWARGRSLPSTK